MQIQKSQPSIQAAQAADGKNKESKNKFNVSFTFVSYKLLYMVYYVPYACSCISNS